MKNIYRHFYILFTALTIISCKKESEKNEESGNMGFSLIPYTESALTFRNQLTENREFSFLTFHYMYNGGGVATGDINNDGLTDIYFTGNQVPDRLYLNKGNLKFEDISQKSGIDKIMHGWHTGVVMVDINGDNYLDIYVCRGANPEPDSLRRNLLFINQKDGTFEEQAKSYGIDDIGFSIQAVFFDYDNDNDLDLFVSNRPNLFSLLVDDIILGRKNAPDVNKSQLYRNNGNETFTNVTKEMGMNENYGYGLSVTTGDFNNDGFQDIYLGNDFTENDYCWINKGGKQFVESIRVITNHTPFYSMGTDISDINNDGLEDILTVEMLAEDYWRAKVTMSPMVRGVEFDDLYFSGKVHLQYMQNVMNLNMGNGHFVDVGQYCGLKNTDWSWSILATDFDNDTYRDIFITNGYKRDVFDNDARAKAEKQLKEEIKNHPHGTNLPPVLSILDNYPSVKLVNYIYKNEGNLKFTKKMTEWGINIPSWSNGAATADFDNDGDLDIVVNNVDDYPYLYKNNLDGSNNSCRIKLEGPALNTAGIGAIVVLTSDSITITEQFKVVRGYLSSVEPIIHFGIGTRKTVDEINVTWPDGKTSTVKNVKANQIATISYKNAQVIKQENKIADPLFKEITKEAIVPAFIHQENNFNDFRIQVLLPHRLSWNGPPIAVGDLNNDQLEDFFVGGASGQAGAIYIQDGNGKFNKKSTAILEQDKEQEDTGACFFDADGDGDLDLYMVSGGTEKPANYTYYQDRLYLNDGKANFTKSKGLPKIGISGSCVKPFDYDQDGDLDLFVGGRVIPNYYPYPSNSFILRNDKGKFTDVSTEIAPCLTKLGLVTDAVIVDINKDNLLDIVVVGEWMPLTFLIQKDGQFYKDSTQFSIPSSKGWWFRIIEADMDSNGENDFIVGNIGLNYKFSASEEKPFEVYANDFDGNTTYDVFLAKHLKNRVVPIRGRQCASEQLPDVINKFPTYRAFAEANIEDILGENIGKAIHLQANTFATTAFLRNGNSFKAVVLPLEAQLSATQGIIFDDFTKDGQSDILIAGNWCAAEYETPWANQGIGRLFVNQGDQKFKAMMPKESGFFVKDDVRHLASIKLGKNKKKGVLVSSNNNILRLFELK
ncbi:MAG: VCBS repeat-containing protein [Bacteroidota bacterium]|nr:VCBS repeat-containing protein [Bacteroidota bacterium]